MSESLSFPSTGFALFIVFSYLSSHPCFATSFLSLCKNLPHSFPSTLSLHALPYFPLLCILWRLCSHSAYVKREEVSADSGWKIKQREPHILAAPFSCEELFRLKHLAASHSSRPSARVSIWRRYMALCKQQSRLQRYSVWPRRHVGNCFVWITSHMHFETYTVSVFCV